MLPPPEEGDEDRPRKTVKLDMRRSVRDNMERLFQTARRGQRGLEHLAERRAVLRAELDPRPRPQADAAPYSDRTGASV